MIVFKDHNLMLSIVVIRKTNLSVIFFWNFLSLFYKEIHNSQGHGAHKDYSLRNCKWQDDKGSL